MELNCDLGEGEDPARTRVLMSLIDAANIACGGHAGDAASIRLCVELAGEFGVRIGAHPGVRVGVSGRGEGVTITPDQLAELVRLQGGRVRGCADKAGLPFHHVKLHGGLYHATESAPPLAEAFVATVAASWPDAIVYARAGGHVVSAARRRRVPVWEEAFLDRGYRADGGLVPRDEPGALLTEPGRIVRRLETLAARGGWQSHTGEWVLLRARTLCVHGDTPGAPEILRAARAALERLGLSDPARAR